MWYLREKKQLSGRWRILFIYFFFLSSERIALRGTSLPYLQYHVVAVRIALKQRRELRGGAWAWVLSQEVENSCLAGVGWILFYWKSWNIS